MRSKIDKITNGKSAQIYTKLLDKLGPYSAAHTFIEQTDKLYLSNYKSNPSMNGRIFEYMICETLAWKDLVPFYYQAKFSLIPNCEFDIVLYHERHPIILSVKTSLRERYKQADLEGLALKQVYRNAKQYLITLSETEAQNTQKKIESGDISGIEKVIIATNPEYDDLLDTLKKQYNFQEVKTIKPMEGKLYIP